MDRLDIYRPPHLVWLNLVAAIFFAALFVLYLLGGRWLWGVVWLSIAMIWTRRYFWARSTPVFEVTREAVTARFSPRRERTVPYAEVTSLEREGRDFLLTLADGSRIPLPQSQVSDEAAATLRGWIRPREP